MEFSTPFHFRLAPINDGRAIYCGAEGAFVGAVPLLSQRPEPDGKMWRVRAVLELNDELSGVYGLPIDVAGKAGRLETIARALNENNAALAQIATLNLRMPDPPDLRKGIQSYDDAFKLIGVLHWTGILKGDWDSDEHPRLGGPPNPGWFTNKPKEPKPPKPGWPSKELGQALRAFVKRWAVRSALGALGFEVGGPGGGVVGVLLDILRHAVTPTELNGGEQRLIDQYNAYYDPPKPLDELRAPPTQNVLGYDQHHIVEQNPDNVAKAIVVKFGRDRLDDPNNIVWVPRLKHEQITGEYNSQVRTPTGTQKLRDLINNDDFETQYEKGLEKLRKYGVLK